MFEKKLNSDKDLTCDALRAKESDRRVFMHMPSRINLYFNLFSKFWHIAYKYRIKFS